MENQLYYVLSAYSKIHHQREMLFGDYDKETVKDEMEDHKDSDYENEYKGYKITRTFCRSHFEVADL